VTNPVIGFIGLGRMGAPMAKNLLAAGYRVIAYDIVPEKTDALAAAGAQAATSCRHVAAEAQVTISIVSDSPDVEKAILGTEGVIQGISKGDIVIEMSTIAPGVGRRVAAALADKGVPMIDCPVSGGPQGAEAGTLSIMCGGPEDTFQQCLPILQVMGERIEHFGPSGSGYMVKLCNQVGCVVTIQAVCEVLALAAKAGLDVRKVWQTVGSGLAASRIMELHGPKMLDRDYAPGFTLSLQEKDLRLVAAAADELEMPLPATAIVHQLIRSLSAKGKGEMGTQALILAMEELANCTVEG
jgi:3-hydroxyisobutyrate dehydrogenase-like beta-hydroxyacid dehydrogenase